MTETVSLTCPPGATGYVRDDSPLRWKTVFTRTARCAASSATGTSRTASVSKSRVASYSSVSE